MRYPKTLVECIYKYRYKDLNPRDILKNSFDRLSIFSSLNAFISVNENMISEYEKNDKNDKNLKLLDGIPFSVKDCYNIKDIKMTCGSKMLEDSYKSPYSATCVNNIFENGGLLIGKTNMDEYCMGSASIYSNYGPVLNPWGIKDIQSIHDIEDIDHEDKVELNCKLTAGGSSGGSSVSVSTNICYASIGSDTGGSVRQPSSFCGNVGLKPSYGRVSRYGLTSFSSSLDHPSLTTKTILDSCLFFDFMIGKDNNDMTTISKYNKYNNNNKNNNDIIIKNLLANLIVKLSLKILNEVIDMNELINDNNKLIQYTMLIQNELKEKRQGYDLSDTKIGVISEANVKEMDQSILNSWLNTIELFNKLGAEIIEVNIPHFKYGIPSYYVLTSAEAASNLSRFDGIHYGNRYNENNCTNDLHDLITKTRTENFGNEIKRRILTGNFVLSASDYDRYYYQASLIRKMITDEFNHAFNEVDILLTPTTPILPFNIESDISPSQMLTNDILTVPSSLAGLPSLSLPVNVTGINNNCTVPIGMQLISKNFDEFSLYYTGLALESLIDF